MTRVFALLAIILFLPSCNETVKNADQKDNITPENIISSLGYDTLRMPTTAFGPGNLVTSKLGTGMTSPLTLTYICSPRYVTIPPVTVDRAASSEVSRSLTRTIDLDVTALGKYGLGTDLEFVDSVKISFSNVSVEQLGYDEMQEVRDNLKLKCAAILENFTRKKLAFQTKQALRADMTYVVTFKSGVSANAKANIISVLDASLGGKAATEAGNTATGTGLYYGVMLEPI